MGSLRAPLVGVVCLSAVMLGACSDKDSTSHPVQQAGVSGARETVIVSRAPLTPTVSVSGAVTVASPYITLAPSRGIFVAGVKPGDRVTAKQSLGTVNGTPVLALTDGTIGAVAPNGDVPQNFPLFEVRYTGFATTLDATSFLRRLDPTAHLSGRFQIREGAGPQDCTAVVLVAQGAGQIAASTGEETGSEDGTSMSTSTLECLFPRSTSVMLGQAVVAVITGPTADNRLVLPLDAVAGREQQGTVNKRKGDASHPVEVKLGFSDGARIEIVSGLGEGDVVELPAPNLEPRS